MSGFADRLAADVTAARRDDLDELVAFRAEMYGAASEQASPARARWLAAHPSTPAGGSNAWLCRRSATVVGQVGEIPLDLWVHGRPRTGIWAVDLMVRPEWRLRGVAHALSTRQGADRDLVAGVDIGDAAARAFRRAGWSDVGAVRAYYVPLDVGAVMQVTGVPGLQAAVGAVAGRLAALEARRRARRVRLEAVAEFDERSDEAWRAVVGDYAVIADRRSAVLRWRFDEIPGRERYRRYLVRRAGEVVGHLVTRLDRWRGLPVLSVVDHLAPRALVPSVLGRAVALARSERVAALRCLALNEPADRALRLMGFLRRRRADAALRFMLRLRPDDPDRGVLLDPSQWFLTAFDSDLDLAVDHAP